MTLYPVLAEPPAKPRSSHRWPRSHRPGKSISRRPRSRTFSPNWASCPTTVLQKMERSLALASFHANLGSHVPVACRIHTSYCALSPDGSGVQHRLQRLESKMISCIGGRGQAFRTIFHRFPASPPDAEHSVIAPLFARHLQWAHWDSPCCSPRPCQPDLATTGPAARQAEHAAPRAVACGPSANPNP